MKTFLTAAAIVITLSAPAFAQMGNIHGAESRGEPLNSSYRASGVDPSTGYTPGRSAQKARAYVVKKKRPRATTTRRTYVRPGY